MMMMMLMQRRTGRSSSGSDTDGGSSALNASTKRPAVRPGRPVSGTQSTPVQCAAPRLLGARFEILAEPRVRLAGLLTGVEGYIESCAMGLLCAHLFADERAGRPPSPPPPTTMMGALYQHVRTPRGPKERYAPSNVNFGLLPPAPPELKAKDLRRRAQLVRAVADFDAWAATRRAIVAAA
mgnify:CR=1 FL=1